MELPNATVCFEIPVTDICSSGLVLVLPLRDQKIPAYCIIFNNSFGRQAFESCVSRNLQELEAIPSIFENGSVCFTDVESNTNVTVHFFCLTEPCADEDCIVRTLLTSYRIIIAGSE